MPAEPECKLAAKCVRSLTHGRCFLFDQHIPPELSSRQARRKLYLNGKARVSPAHVPYLLRMDQLCSVEHGSSPAASRPPAVVASMESAAVEVEQLEAAFQSLEVEACQPLWVVKDEVSTKEAAPRAEKTHKEVREADCDPEVEGKDQFEGGGPSKEMNEDDKGNKDAAESENKQKEHWLRVDVCHATVGVSWECSCCVLSGASHREQGARRRERRSCGAVLLHGQVCRSADVQEQGLRSKNLGRLHPARTEYAFPQDNPVPAGARLSLRGRRHCQCL